MNLMSDGGVRKSSMIDEPSNTESVDLKEN